MLVIKGSIKFIFLIFYAVIVLSIKIGSIMTKMGQRDVVDIEIMMT